MYFAHEQFRFWGSGGALASMTLVVASPLPADELRPAVGAAVRSLDADLPVDELRTMEDVRRAAEALPRFLMTVLGAFSAIALLLAALGIYGVMAQAVGKRVAEFGLRMALGARPVEVTRMVVRQGARLALVGIAFGVAGSLVVTRVLGSQLYEVSPTDPLTLTAVSALLGLTALVACYVPARRATRVDPTKVLRAE
jgi:ABC-type antimicrobial peptide transport system permease subunit